MEDAYKCCQEPKLRGGRCDNCGKWLEDELGRTGPHPDLVLTDEQKDVLRELGIDPAVLFPIRLQNAKEPLSPMGTGWADVDGGNIVFVGWEPHRFLYWMGEENAGLICYFRGLTVKRVTAEKLRARDPRRAA
jgi:hypothetical protein